MSGDRQPLLSFIIELDNMENPIYECEACHKYTFNRVCDYCRHFNETAKALL